MKITRVTGRASVTGASVSVYLGDQRVALSNLQRRILFNATKRRLKSSKGTLGGGNSVLPAAPNSRVFSISQFLFNVQRRQHDA